MRRALSTILIVAGVLLLADAALTVLWQEPVSALYGRLQQDKLRRPPRRAGARAAGGGRPARAGPAGREPAAGLRRRSLARAASRAIRWAGSGCRRSGSRRCSWRAPAPRTCGTGPGHYPETQLPGQRGTVAIAGHRTTYGAPFHNLDELDRGDRIELVHALRPVRVPGGEDPDRDAHRDVGHRPGRPRPPGPVACHPLYSAAQRIIVFADQVRAQPRGPAAG